MLTHALQKQKKNHKSKIEGLLFMFQKLEQNYGKSNVGCNIMEIMNLTRDLRL